MAKAKPLNIQMGVDEFAPITRWEGGIEYGLPSRQVTYKIGEDVLSKLDHEEINKILGNVKTARQIPKGIKRLTSLLGEGNFSNPWIMQAIRKLRAVGGSLGHYNLGLDFIPLDAIKEGVDKSQFELINKLYKGKATT